MNDVFAPRLLVFDWDGTLMDSLGSIVACTQAAILELGLPAVPDEKIRRVVGLGLRETIDELCPGCDAEVAEQVAAAYRHLWLSRFRDVPILFPGVSALLRDLSAQGYLLAVATGKGRRGLDHALAATDLADVFPVTRTVDEAPSKPHPGMLLDILQVLDVEPDQALMIGDTTYDVLMATSAGVLGLGVLSGGHRREDLLGAGAIDCLEDVSGLGQWLQGSSQGSSSSLRSQVREQEKGRPAGRPVV